MNSKERILVAVDPSLLEELVAKVQNLEKKVEEISNQRLQKENYYLKEACQLKGVNYNSLCSEGFRHFRPNNGTPDMVLNKRDSWRRATIAAWLEQSDSDLEQQLREKLRLQRIGQTFMDGSGQKKVQ